MTPDASLDVLLGALRTRHLANLTRQEFTRAVRALSVRYVEQRGRIRERSPLDTAGKRAAFGLYYAGLHLVTVDRVVAALGADGRVLTRLVDLGCGTGVCGAAWALRLPAPRPTLEGIDQNGWALDEGRWLWRTAGLAGRTRRGDAVKAVGDLAGRTGALSGTALLAGWSVNELDAEARDRLQTGVRAAVARGAALLVLEPLARGITPWWDGWTAAFAPEGVTAHEFRFDDAVPPVLADLAASAGLTPVIGARVLWNPGR